MKKFSAFSLLKTAAGLAAIFAACAGIEGFRQLREPKPEPEIVRPVRTVRLDGGAVENVHRYFGTVQGAQRVNLSFRVSGPLLELPVEKGVAVKKGDLLGRVDPRDFRTRLTQAQAVLAQARAQYNDAATNFKRYDALYRQKVIAAAQYDAYKTQLNVARSAVQQAEAQARTAADALRDTELRAPFDGVVVDRMAEKFQDVLPKQPVLSLQEISTLEIHFAVPDKDVLSAPVPAGIDARDLARYAASFGMEARFDAIGGRAFPVRLKEFAAQADPRTKTYPVTVVMPQPEGARVLPGMAVTVTVDFSAGAAENRFLVPEPAVLAGENGARWLWRFEDGQVRRVPVTVAGWKGAQLEVSGEGLRDGDLIVTAGVHFLKDGQKVRLMKAGERS